MRHDIFLVDGNTFRGERRITEGSERYYIGRAKYMPLADMKLAGRTLQEIADTRGTTKEAVRVLLKRYFPDLTFPHGKRTISK